MVVAPAGAAGGKGRCPAVKTTGNMDNIASQRPGAILNFWIAVKGHPGHPVNPTGKIGRGAPYPVIRISLLRISIAALPF